MHSPGATEGPQPKWHYMGDKLQPRGARGRHGVGVLQEAEGISVVWFVGVGEAEGAGGYQGGNSWAHPPWGSSLHTPAPARQPARPQAAVNYLFWKCRCWPVTAVRRAQTQRLQKALQELGSSLGEVPLSPGTHCLI